MTNWLAELPEVFPDAMVIVDSRGRIIQASAQAASLFGFDEREMNGMLIHALFPGQLLALPGRRPAQQGMDAANFRLQQLRLRLQDQGARRILDKLQEALTLSSSHLRQLIFDLRPSALEDGSLGTALRAYLEHMQAEAGIAYRLDDRLSAWAPDGVALLIYRNVLEVLANVRKHARASTVTVELLDLEGGYLVRIVDDGVGYDPADIEDRPGHLGLVLIRERAELAGGWSRIESSPGTGTTVEFWVPLGVSSTEPDAGHERAG